MKFRPVTDQVRTPIIPDNDRFWASIGASWIVIKGMHFDLAYTHIWVKDSKHQISWPAIPLFGTTGASIYVGTVKSHCRHPVDWPGHAHGTS